jgi:hypothetical protein
MTIKFIAEPREVYNWDNFKKEKEPYSIALDGFVDAPTKRDTKSPHANFDHHSKSDRPSTLATCMQVYEEINMGLFETFRKEGIPTATIYINDPDEDTCLSIWLLQHHELVIDHANPRINRLVSIEDKLDRHAGAYPFGDKKLRRQMAWIFEPYNNARFSGKLAKMDDLEMHSLVEAVLSRINEHVFNEGEELSLEGNYEVTGGGQGWSMIKETGPASRIAMYNDGITSYAKVVSENDESWTYTLGRRSPWDKKFDIPKLYGKLNNLESAIVTENNKWDGSNTIGGSPRRTGSNLSPKKLEDFINEQLEGNYK